MNRLGDEARQVKGIFKSAQRTVIEKEIVLQNLKTLNTFYERVTLSKDLDEIIFLSKPWLAEVKVAGNILLKMDETMDINVVVQKLDTLAKLAWTTSG